MLRTNNQELSAKCCFFPLQQQDCHWNQHFLYPFCQTYYILYYSLQKPVDD